MKNYFFLLDHFLHKKKIALSADPRPASFPYLTGDGFRKLADHVHDETADVRPEKVKNADLIFLQADRLEQFFSQVHPRINNPYKLISHNSDRNIGEVDLALIDNKIISWFAQNVTVDHPKLVPLPIGLENLHYYQNGIPALFERVRARSVPKKPRILYGFSLSTNPAERQPALDVLRKLDTADQIEGFPHPPQYLKLLAQYQFVASPPGHGLDCHRTWEALYLGVIPIVKRSPAMDYFARLGLPLWIVDDWTELTAFTEDELREKIPARLDPSILHLDFWADLIRFRQN